MQLFIALSLNLMKSIQLILLVVIIFDKTNRMKPKKKSSAPLKKGGKKIAAAKPIVFVDKTIVTTKQKTHATIEDHFQILQLKKVIRNHKNVTPREPEKQKFEKCNLSPFSNHAGSSCSPQLRKNISPRFNQDKEKRKTKSKHTLLPQKPTQRRKSQITKRQTRDKKMTKVSPNHQQAYENLFMRRLDEKKITQMSEQSSASIPRFTKLQINFANTLQVKPIGKDNKAVIKQLKQKIHEKYKRELPGLKKNELKFLCSIVLIQRMWRQSKIKNFISEFISPRSRIDAKISAQSQRDCSKLDLTSITQEHTSQLLKKYNHTNLTSQKKLNIERQVNSTEIESNRKYNNSFLKDLQLSSQLSPHKQAKMIQFVTCLRDISFFKPTKTEKRSKINVFNLQQSLSQKCLMQRFYEKVFKDSPTKKNNFQIFSLKKEQKQLQRSIQLINTMKSPEKVEIIEIEQRFQTEMHEPINPILTAQVSVSTQPFQVQEKKQINTLKQLNLIADQVISMLLADFSEEFHGFTTRSILKKKKKARLPGLKVTTNNIRQYLNGLIAYMLQQYDDQVLRRFRMANPLSFLKIHHEYDDEDEYIQDEEDQEFNMPIVPNTLFYQYQLIYQQKIFTITDEDKKYSNFLEGLIKIHNLLLANCVSELLEKTRMDRITLPWDQKFQPQRTRTKRYKKQDFKEDLSKMVDIICSSAFMRVGQFHKSLENIDEEKKMLKSINQEYKAQGNDWSAQYEYLQMRMDLAKYTEQCLLNQIINELMKFL